MPSTGRMFRVFVSSTFSDLVEERNVLQAETFPRLERYCRDRGASFQAIDLRWGVSGEASLDQQAMNICLGEIRRCQEITPRPNFLVLLGRRYGWMPPPPQVRADVFDRIRHTLDAEQGHLLDTWYRLDDNAVPAEYVLQPRVPEGPYVEYARWQPIEEALQHALSAGARAIGLTGDDLLPFCASATHQEITAGALSVEHPENKVVCVFREMEIPAGARGTGNFVDADQGPIDKLREQLAVLVPGNIVRCTAIWSTQTCRPTRDHLTRLADRVYEALRQQIDLELGKPTEQQSAGAWHIEPHAKLDGEGLAHQEVAERHLTHFVGRDDILRRIAEYVGGVDALAKRSTTSKAGLSDWRKRMLPFGRSDSSDSQRLSAVGSQRSIGKSPMLAVTGEGGMGKSALMAKAVEHAQKAHPRAEVVYRFIGATPASSSGAALIRSLCSELCRKYGGNEADVPQGPNELMHDFPKRLNSATTSAPLILFLDALDQIPEHDPFRRLAWLPFELPEHVRLIVSTRPVETLRALEPRHPQVVELCGMSREEGESLLDLWLADARRKLKTPQRAEVVDSFVGSGCRPLYLRLAFEEARKWTSWEAPAPLTPGLEGIIRRNLFARLAHRQQHGLVLVSRALGYLAASRYGLTEGEMLSVLSHDAVVYGAFLQRAFHLPPDIVACAERLLHEEGPDEVDAEAWLDEVRRDEGRVRGFLAGVLGGADGPRLPIVLWARFLADLEPYLTRRAAEAGPLLGFYHRELGDVSASEYLAPAKQELHSGLADCFRERGDPNKDRSWHGERRALSELPYHMPAAERWEELEQTLTELPFLEAKVIAGLTFELPENFRWAVEALPADRPQRRILELLDEAIRRDIYFIARHADDYPQALFQCAWNHGWWYDCPDAVKYYEVPVGGWRQPPPWERSGPKLHTLLEQWRAGQGVLQTGAPWLRSHRPPSVHVGSPLKAVLRGHKSAVNSVALSPDGARVISGSNDHTVRLWDTASGKELAVLHGHEDDVSSVAFSPDGTRIASGSAGFGSKDNTVRLWDAVSGAELAVLRGHGYEDHVLSVAFSPDGARIASGSGSTSPKDNTVRLWDATSGAEVAVLRAHKDWAKCVAFSPDGARIASGSVDKTVRLWDAASGAELAVLRGHENSVQSVAFSPDGARIASGSADRTVRLWDAASGAELAVLHGHENAVNSVALSPDGTLIVSGSGDHTVRLWDAASGAEFAVLQGHKKSVNSVAFSPDGTLIVSGSQDNTVHLWDAGLGAQTAVLRGHENRVATVTFSPDGARIASGSEDKTVRLWDTDSGAELAVLRGHEKEVDSVAFSLDGARIVSGSRDSRMRLWDAASGAELAVLHEHDRVHSLAFSPDGARIVSGSADGSVRLWDTASGAELADLRGHEHAVNSVAFSPDGALVVSGSWDNTVRLWDAGSGAQLAVLRGHQWPVESVAFSRDSERIVSGSHDNTVRLWDVRSGRCLEVIRGTSDVSRIAARPEAFPFRALWRDRETIVEDIRTGRPVARFPDEVEHIVTHLSGRTWAGSVGAFFTIFTLEGGSVAGWQSPPRATPSHQQPTEPKRWWQFWR